MRHITFSVICSYVCSRAGRYFLDYLLLDSLSLMTNLISAISWVRRGVAAQNPEKYVLDEKELERVSTLARIELEDARAELERAHIAAQSMGKGVDEDGVLEDDDNTNWVE
jgi:periodic tryptophan protein 1